MGENQIEKLSLDGLDIDTGVKTFALNGGETIRFNPTDPNLVARLLTATQKLDAKQNDYTAKVAEIEKNGTMTVDVLNFLNQLNDDMFEILGDVFTQEITPKAFDGVGLYAFNTAGIPIWIAFLTAVMDRMDVSVKTAQSGQTAKIEKLMSKYKRK